MNTVKHYVERWEAERERWKGREGGKGEQLTFTKSFEVSSRSEKGLHDLNGWALIMPMKKFIHETVEKFFAMTPSKD